MRKLTPTIWRAAIPADLRRLPRWVGRDGKTPLHPVREVGAKSGQPATWGTFDEAAAFYERYAAKPDRGAGFEFAADDGLVGVDLDLALDEHGVPYPWAADLVAPFEDLGGAYIEVSPSGRGLHLITRAQLPRNPNRIEYGGITDGKKKSGVEVYKERRYFTITGDVWRGNGALGDGQALIQGILDASGLTARMASRDVEGPTHQSGQEPERAEEIASALAVLDPDMDYPDWLNIGMALHAALGSAGFRLWDEWSARGSKYDGPRDLLVHWRSFTAGKGVALGTLIHMAQDAGWTRPGVNAIQEFNEFVEDDYDDILGPEVTEVDAFPKDDPDRIPYHVTKKGIAKTAGNIALFFSQDPTWKGRLRWNIRRGAELDGNILEDAGYTVLGTAAERALGFDGAAAVDHVYRGIEVAARRSEYDPVKEFVLSAPWDGVPRIDDWLVRIGAEDTKINRLISRRFIIGMAGRAINEDHPNQPPLMPDQGTQFDYMLILEGTQGLRKTSMCEVLSPPGYFFNSQIALTSMSGTKDFYDAISRNYVVEVAELDAMSRAETSTVKSAVSGRTDSFRPAYGRTTIRRARIAVLLGTTNDKEWNKDVTGARRFWPVPLWHLDENHPIDTEWVRANLQQMLAEGVARYRTGEIFWADAQMNALLAPLYRERLNRSDWMDSAEEFVTSDEIAAHGWFTSHLIRQSDPFIKRTTGQMLNRFLRDVLHCREVVVKISHRMMRVWLTPDADPINAPQIVASHPYAAVDAEFKVLP